MSKGKKEPPERALHKVLSHSLRVEILLAIQRAGRLSPTAFVDEVSDREREVGLNVVAYHFRVLSRYEVIEVIEEVPRRGATEHVYALNPASPVLDVMQVTRLLSDVGWGGSDLDPVSDGAHAWTITPMEIDELGQEEVGQILRTVGSSLSEVTKKCRQRLNSSGGTASSVRVGLVAFQHSETSLSSNA